MRKIPVANSLTSDEINEALKTLPGWSFVNNKLHKEFRFKNFKQAFGFMTQLMP